MAIYSAEPVRNSQLGAGGAAQLLIPWIMAGVTFLASRWGVQLPPDYQIQISIGVASVFSIAAGEWARRQVEAPKLISNGDLAAFRAWQKAEAGRIPSDERQKEAN